MEMKPCQNGHEGQTRRCFECKKYHCRECLFHCDDCLPHGNRCLMQLYCLKCLHGVNEKYICGTHFRLDQSKCAMCIKIDSEEKDIQEEKRCSYCKQKFCWACWQTFKTCQECVYEDEGEGMKLGCSKCMKPCCPPGFNCGACSVTWGLCPRHT